MSTDRSMREKYFGQRVTVIAPRELLWVLTERRTTDPTQGGAVIRGRLSCLLDVGTGFHPELTGRENVFLNGAIAGRIVMDGATADVARRYRDSTG